MKNIKVFLFIFVLSFLMIEMVYSQESDDVYVCFPCGYTCDSITHQEPGNCPSCKLELIKKSEIKYTDLSPDDVAEIISENEDYIILDVRTVGEYSGEFSDDDQAGHLINAINIPHRELYARISELEDYKEKKIIVYCSHSHRSRFSSQMLTDDGFLYVYNMAEGITSFKAKALKNTKTGNSLIVK